VVLPATTARQKAARCLGWAICIEIASLVVGLFLFFGSIHSSAVMIYASAVIVPALFLVIFGLLRPDNFLTMVITVAALQFPGISAGGLCGCDGARLVRLAAQP
jgi:general stress protein CsbA